MILLVGVSSEDRRDR